MRTLKEFDDNNPPLLKEAELATNRVSLFLKSRIIKRGRFLNERRTHILIKDEINNHFNKLHI